MNIAIVAPSPYHFVMGGAEHFWSGLQRFINEHTSHGCELIKVPTREGNLVDLVRAYRQHSRNDLLGYDRIVSSKYPAWMTLHPHHALYMLHTLRGLYDTYHFTREPLEPEWPDELRWVRDEIGLLAHGKVQDNGAVVRLLDVMESALETQRIPAAFARFPGPFARHLVHALDRFATQPGRIEAYATMSRTVAARQDYFPPGAQVGVLHPPTRLEGFRCGGDDYLFTVSRLDGPKRIGLIIEAMRHVRSEIPLLIGGTGPDEQRLRELAAGDPRIRFLGSLTDQQLLDGYADALAVPFVPYDEDYGLITIEAMRSGKPVITVQDAGGVTEFVHHGRTGLCVPPDPLALAGAIDELCNDRQRARAMGREARRSVAGISWKPLAEFALGQALPAPRVPVAPARQHLRKRRRKAVVAVTFGVSPPRGGGQSRVYHLYKALSATMDIVLLCLDAADAQPRRLQIAPGLWEVRIPKSAEHEQQEIEAARTVAWTPVTDIVAGREIHRTPAFLQALEDESQDADLLVACHPFFASLLRRHRPDLPLWYEAQDVELPLKRGMLPPGPGADALLQVVEAEERLAWTESEVVYACADEDLVRLTEIYGPTQALTLEVPNGFAEEEVRFVDATERRRLKDLIGLGDQPLAIFLGSWHGPNLEAAERVFACAQALPHVCFALVGSAGLYFRDKPVPPNVRLVGPVDEGQKQVFLGAADVALNPMTSGTGSNLKMLDYFASGVPVLSTRFGARGIDARPGEHYLACEADTLLPELVAHLVMPQRAAPMVERANRLARRRYSWRAIGEAALLRLAPQLG